MYDCYLSHFAHVGKLGIKTNTNKMFFSLAVIMPLKEISTRVESHDCMQFPEGNSGANIATVL